MTTTIAERVAKGAALLDVKTPGWWRRIDLSRLDMNCAERCVSGQSLGDYHESATEMFGDDWDAPAAHGFNAAGGERNWVEWESEMAGLDAEWRRVIGARRAGA